MDLTFACPRQGFYQWQQLNTSGVTNISHTTHDSRITISILLDLRSPLSRALATWTLKHGYRLQLCGNLPLTTTPSEWLHSEEHQTVLQEPMQKLVKKKTMYRIPVNQLRCLSETKERFRRIPDDSPLSSVQQMVLTSTNCPSTSRTLISMSWYTETIRSMFKREITLTALKNKTCFYVIFRYQYNYVVI